MRAGTENKGNQKMVSEGTAEPNSFTASEVWLSKFLERHDLTMHRTSL